MMAMVRFDGAYGEFVARVASVLNRGTYCCTKKDPPTGGGAKKSRSKCHSYFYCNTTVHVSPRLFLTKTISYIAHNIIL